MSNAENQEVKKSADIGGMFKDTAILLVITLVAGLLLGLVYQITKEPIAIQKEKAKQEACKAVFADAASFAEVDFAQPDEQEWAAAGFAQETIDEVMEAQDEFEFIPVVVDEFSTGYKFKGAHMVESKARDDDEHVLAIVKGLDVEYTNADGEFFSFKMEKTPAVLREQIMAEQITPDKVQTYKGVDINYNFIAQKCVGGHYEPTAEEQQLMEAGKLNIMYDSETEHEPELFNLIQVKWFVDDVEYLIMAFDKWAPDLTEADLFAMAKEVIDQQQSAAQ